MTLGNRGNTHEFHEFQYHDFSPSNKFKLQFLPYSGRFIYLTFANTNKHEQNDEIRHSSFRSSKPHEVKSTDKRCILATNINICREENTTRRKKCQIFASAMYSSYHAGVSLVCYTAVFSVVTQRSSPQTAAENRTTFLSRD